MDEERIGQRREGPTITLSPPDSFKRNGDLFDNENTFPDLDFIITGLERPLKLHKNILSQTSKLVEEILKAKLASESGNGNEIKWMFDTSKEVDREALVKVLRFCYGGTITVGVNNGECCAVIAALFRLEVICAAETADKLTRFAVEQAKKNLTVGTQLLMATQHYPECTNTNFCALDRRVAEVVLSKENMQEDYETVVERCLMSLPAMYLDIAKYGDVHTKWSEFATRTRYVRYHSESLKKKEKEAIVMKCDWKMLMSAELIEVIEFGFLEQGTIMGMYHAILEHTEEDRNDWRLHAVKTEREADKIIEADNRTINNLKSMIRDLRIIIRLR